MKGTRVGCSGKSAKRTGTRRSRRLSRRRWRETDEFSKTLVRDGIINISLRNVSSNSTGKLTVSSISLWSLRERERRLVHDDWHRPVQIGQQPHLSSRRLRQKRQALASVWSLWGGRDSGLHQNRRTDFFLQVPRAPIRSLRRRQLKGTHHRPRLRKPLHLQLQCRWLPD